MRIFKIIILFGLMSIFFSVHSQIYKWTDSSGQVHFSDEPHPGAQSVDLPPPQTFSSPPIQKNKTTNINEQDKTQKPVDYKIQIVQPEPQATIRNNQGYVPIVVQTDPELKDGAKLQVMYNGQPLGKPSTSTSFTLRDVYRGSHTVSAKVIDANGKEISQAEPVTFYMHRPRTGMVPQTPRPR